MLRAPAIIDKSFLGLHVAFATTPWLQPIDFCGTRRRIELWCKLPADQQAKGKTVKKNNRQLKFKLV